MKKNINWDVIDNEFKQYLEKEKNANEMINDSRSKVLTDQELIEKAKNANNLADKNKIDKKVLTKKGDTL